MSLLLKTIITSIQKNENTIWVSLYGTGIIKIKNGDFSLYSKENKLLNTLSKCKKIIASDNSNLKGVEYKDTSWFKNK